MSVSLKHKLEDVTESHFLQGWQLHLDLPDHVSYQLEHEGIILRVIFDQDDGC